MVTCVLLCYQLTNFVEVESHDSDMALFLFLKVLGSQGLQVPVLQVQVL